MKASMSIAGSLALITSLAVVNLSPAAQGAPGSMSPAEDSAAITPAIARMQASTSGQRVLIENLTSEDTVVFANPDGTFTSEIAAGPVRVEDPSDPEGWIPIDTDLSFEGDRVRPAATTIDIEFSDGGQGDAASMEVGPRSFALVWPASLPTPSISGDTAVYQNVLPGGIDLALSALPSGFSHSFVVDEAPTEPLSFRFPLDLEGLTAALDADGNLSLAKPNGMVVASADPALMWDASLGERSHEPEHAEQVETRLVTAGPSVSLEITPDPAFFETPGLVYPVTIDPSPNLQVSKDTYVHSQYPTQTYSNSTDLKLGKVPVAGSEKARSFIKFDISSITGKHIVSTALKVYEDWSYSCTAAATDVYRIISSWESPTWNIQPTYGAVFASKAFAKGYSGSCPADWVTINDGDPSGGRTLSQLIQGWVDGSMSNYGLALRATDETASNSWKTFRSSDAASTQPYLTVTYDSYPDSPTYLDAIGSAETAVLHGTFSDPDGGTGKVLYNVYSQNGTTLASGSGPIVASGSDSAWSIPSGTVASGQFYTWSATAFDGQNFSVAPSDDIPALAGAGEPETSTTITIPPDGDKVPNPGTHCILYEHHPYRVSDGSYPPKFFIQSRPEGFCDMNFPNLWIRSNLYRGRWYGTQELGNSPVVDECNACDQVNKLLKYNCTGDGSYNYWTKSVFIIVDYQGSTWTAKATSWTFRLTC
jgi:hypothetical protein